MFGFAKLVAIIVIGLAASYPSSAQRDPKQTGSIDCPNPRDPVPVSARQGDACCGVNGEPHSVG